MMRGEGKDQPEETQEPVIDAFEEACHDGCKVLQTSDVMLR